MFVQRDAEHHLAQLRPEVLGEAALAKGGATVPSGPVLRRCASAQPGAGIPPTSVSVSTKIGLCRKSFVSDRRPSALCVSV
jgi:hypothetical protein